MSDSQNNISDEDGYNQMRPKKKAGRGRPKKIQQNVSNGDFIQETSNESAVNDIKPFTLKDPFQLNFDDIAGLQHQIEQVKEVILLPIMYPKLFGECGVKLPKGLIFEGGSGCGKTYLARVLCNVCQQISGIKINFFLRNASDILNQYLGESEKNLRDLFEIAKKNAPSIIYFDEIDSIACKRSEKNEQVVNSILNTLLTLMDGIESRGNVVVIGSTNRLHALDPALLRPLRFDRVITFELPLEDARQQALEIYLNKLNIANKGIDSEDIMRLAADTKGFNFAELSAIVSEAYLIAIRSQLPQIYQSSKRISIDNQMLILRPEDLRQACEVVKTQKKIKKC